MKILLLNNCNSLTEKEFVRAFSTIKDENLDITIFDNSYENQYTRFKTFLKKSSLKVDSVREIDVVVSPIGHKEYDCLVRLQYGGIPNPYQLLPEVLGFTRIINVITKA